MTIKYMDAGEFGCTSIILSGAAVVRAGCEVYSMPVSEREHDPDEYERFAREADVHFIFDDDKPALSFYTIPYISVWAVDSRGGFLGTVGGMPDIDDETAPVCYISPDKECFKIAEDFRAFIDSPAGWQERREPTGGVKFYASKAEAKAENDFIDKKWLDEQIKKY